MQPRCYLLSCLGLKNDRLHRLGIRIKTGQAAKHFPSFPEPPHVGQQTFCPAHDRIHQQTVLLESAACCNALSHGDRIATHWEVALPFIGASSLRILLFSLQGLTDLLGLLWAQVQWHILLALVLLPSFRLLLLVVDRQNARNGFPHGLDLGQLGSSATGDLGHTKLGQLCLRVIQLLQQLLGGLVPQLVGFHLHGSHRTPASLQALEPHPAGKKSSLTSLRRQKRLKKFELEQHMHIQVSSSAYLVYFSDLGGWGYGFKEGDIFCGALRLVRHLQGAKKLHCDIIT